MTNNDGSVIEVKGGGTLTLTDSAPGTMHYYSVDPDTKLWTILPDDTGAAGSTASRFSLAALGEPGRFRIKVPFRMPACARDSMARLVICMEA